MSILSLEQPDPERKPETAVLPSRDEDRDAAESRAEMDDRDDADYRERGIVREREPGRMQLKPELRSNGAMAALDDNALLQRVRMGAEESLGELYDRYGKTLYSVALRVMRDPSAAEDVLCDIFMDVWRNADNYMAIRGPLAGWLAVLARNRAIDALRRKRPLHTLEDILLASNFDLAQEAERTMLMEKARSVIYALPAEQRKTLEMAFFDGLSHVEIAEMSGDSETTVRGRLRAALLTLRKAMQA